jgi:hypothetical protein
LPQWKRCADRRRHLTPMLNKDFKEFVGLLNSTGVEYLLVGGYALAAHGRPRNTGDLDIWVNAEPANVQLLLRALDLFGFGSLGLIDNDFLQPDSVVQLGYPPARIDLLTSIDGVRFGECYPRRMTLPVSGVDLPIINLEDFRANKLASGRLKDLADLQSLDDPGKPP